MSSIRKTTPADIADADYKHEPLQIKNGRLWTSTKIDSSDVGSTISAYQTNDIDENNTTANVTYIGMEKDNGAWCIKKINESTAATPAFSYATVANNATVTTYTAAWAAIGSLTYQDYSLAF